MRGTKNHEESHTESRRKFKQAPKNIMASTPRIRFPQKFFLPKYHKTEQNFDIYSWKNFWYIKKAWCL